MSNSLKSKPKGLLRWALRAPKWFYHAGLGWMLGERFLMLIYRGRKSGLRRETVIEVVDHDPTTDTYYVASGWGTKSDWFQSIRSNPEVIIQVGRRKLNVQAHILDQEEAAHRLCIYAKKHPLAFHELSKLLTGKALAGAADECRHLARTVPVIAFSPLRN